MAHSNAAAALAALGRVGRRYGPGLAARKLALLAVLASGRLGSAAQVRRLHELLCFLDAYPDDRRVRVRVRRMLLGFRRRPDLMRHRQALAGSGIAGTDTPYRFFWPTARWIAARWPGALRLDRGDPGQTQAVLDALPQLLGPVQAELLRRTPRPSLALLERFRPRGLSDADYFISLVSAMPGDDFTREAFFDRIDPPFVLRAGRTTPERTTARLDWVGFHPQRQPVRGPRPELRAEAQRPPRRIVDLDPAHARLLIRLARISMATRERDVAVFQFANDHDAFLVDDGCGLAFAMVGTVPERRLILPAVYAGLTLQNGVPIGYVQLDVLGCHAEISFNQFDTFRGACAANVFARLIAMSHHAFHCDRFSIEPYQLGDGNDEGIESGAWWFYYRFGFRPHDAGVRRLAAREVARVAARPSYRSPPRVLKALARGHLFFSLDPAARCALPRAARLLEAAARERRHFGQADAAERRAAATDAARRWLGVRRFKPRAERSLAQWSGIVLALARRGHWTQRERGELARLVEAKAAAIERTYLQELMRHHRFRRALDC